MTDIITVNFNRSSLSTILSAESEMSSSAKFDNLKLRVDNE